MESEHHRKMNDKKDIVTELRDFGTNGYMMRAAREIELLRIEIDTLRRERDEARRDVCELKSHNFAHKITPKGYAELRKWDCYKEDDK
jgi:hypothetical protein